MSRTKRLSAGNIGVVKPAYNGAHSSASRKRAVTIPPEDEASTQSPKRNRSESNDQSDRLGPHPISNDNQTYRTPTRGQTTTTSNSYFNKGLELKEKPDDSSNKRQTRDLSNQKFPPFRLLLDDSDGHRPTELSIIKEINKFTRLNCTYGRFTKSNDDKTSFLLYASSITQFEFLLKKENWPNNINNNSYTLELPNRTPASYSLIVRNVPPQWDVESFGNELKQQYPTIIRTVRLFRNGGIPLAKVRLDFSSHDAVAELLLAKRMLVDDCNLAFPIEPYVLPTKVLRCYNCQALGDHVSAHCPVKDDPICFRCAQHHPYNPKCENRNKCIHCEGEHMAGNPSCPVKLAKRKELNLLRMSSKSSNKPNQESTNEYANKTTKQTFVPAWQTAQGVRLFSTDFLTSNMSENHRSSINNAPSDNELSINIIAKLDNINCTMQDIKSQQVLLETKIEKWNDRITNNQNEIHLIYRCLRDSVIPTVLDIIKIVSVDAKQTNKHNLTRVKGKLEECFNNLSRLFPAHDHSQNDTHPQAANPNDVFTHTEYKS